MQKIIFMRCNLLTIRKRDRVWALGNIPTDARHCWHWAIMTRFLVEFYYQNSGKILLTKCKIAVTLPKRRYVLHLHLICRVRFRFQVNTVLSQRDCSSHFHDAVYDLWWWLTRLFHIAPARRDYRCVSFDAFALAFDFAN